MTLSSCFCRSQMVIKPIGPFHEVKGGQTFIVASRGITTKSLGQQLRTRTEPPSGCSFVEGSTVIVRPKLLTVRRSFRVNASWVTASQLARSVFTLGTAAVLPFYSLMVFAPKASMTKKTVGSNIPYVVLGLLYGYLLYLSWKPDTIRLMFAGKYWLPELSGIAKMFSDEMTLASAWIHLLAIDLFAARQVFLDGLEKHVETRHSVSLCLFCCPIGIVAHVITKALAAMATKREEMQKDGC